MLRQDRSVRRALMVVVACGLLAAGCGTTVSGAGRAQVAGGLDGAGLADQASASAGGGVDAGGAAGGAVGSVTPGSPDATSPLRHVGPAAGGSADHPGSVTVHQRYGGVAIPTSGRG